MARQNDEPAMTVIRIVPKLSSEAFVASRDFYAAMFDLVVSVEDYGQRHFLLVDPNGLVLNVMSTI